MIKRICTIWLLVFIGVHWQASALSQEQQERTEETLLRRVQNLQGEAQESDAALSIAAGDTIEISPGTTKAFTERVSSSGCSIPGMLYGIETDMPSFMNFTDKGVSLDIMNGRLTMKFEIEVESSAPGGSYDVKLTYRFGLSGGVLLCTRIFEYVIKTGEVAAPTADFSGSPRTGQAPLAVQFTDASSGQITSRSWDFGDGQSSTATNPSHAYTDAGIYTVALTVSGPGGSNTKRRSNYITVTAAELIADFTATPTSGFKPLTVQFTEASSGQITSRTWNFGDGQTSTATNPSHTYTNAGTYTVALTVSGPTGTNTKTRADYITVNEPKPVANFNASPTSGEKPLTVQFADASSGEITSRSWNFGDGQSSTLTNPSHTYVDAGTYTVSLTVNGPGGTDTSTRSNYITVREPVLAAPRHLTAQSGIADRVPLSWEPPEPATSDTVELAYDDGSSESLLRGNFSGADLAVRFTPPSYPVNLITMGFFARGNASNDTYGVKVYLDPAGSNTGPAGTPVLTGQVSFPSSGFILAEFPTPITIESGDFYIVLSYISGTTQDFALGMDESSDALRSWIKSGGVFKLARDVSPDFAGNFVLRATVVTASSASRIAGTGAVDARGDAVAEGNHRHQINQIVPLQSGPDDFQFSTSAYSIFRSDFHHGVGILSTLQPHSLAPAAALNSYNIYRSAASPVGVVPQNRIGSVNASTTAFDDTHMNAGTTYYYVVTAVYDAGESEPSNEASATPISSNHSPVVANPITDKSLIAGGADFTHDMNVAPRVFTDADGDALSYTAGSSNSSIAGAMITGSMLTVSPVAVGSATITIAANDGKGGTASTTFTVVVSPANTYCSPDAPNIPDPGTATASLSIDTDVIVGDLNVRLFITHSYDSDLDVSLTSPDGTTVELFSDVGGSSDNFGSACSPAPDCIIDDQAATNIANGSAPFIGRFQSEGRGLNTFSGKNAKGTWVLTIEDDEGVGAGSLSCWCLEIEPAAPNDVGVTAMDLPKLVLLGNSAPVSVMVKNFGSSPQSSFPVSYQINGGPAATENFAGTLETGTSVNKIFAGDWTPAAEGIYRFTAWTMLVGDANSNNDTLPTPKEVVVRESNATPSLAGINNYSVRAGATRYLPIFAVDADGDSMTFTIPDNPGFLSLRGFSQDGDTASATLVIAAPREATGSYHASVEVRDRFDAQVAIPFTLQIVPRVLPAPANLMTSLSQNGVQLDWQAPVIGANSPYAGIWSGTTSQNLAVYLSVTDDGFIDSLNVRFQTFWAPSAYCTGNFWHSGLVEVANDKLEASLHNPLTSVSTTLHGTFSTASAVGGSYDEYSGGGFIYCGSQFFVVFGGTQLNAGTWQASKTTSGGGSAPPVLQGYDIYRSSQPDARLSGTKIGSVDANTTTYLDANIFDGMYYYQVTAIYDLGESDPSTETSRLITGVKDPATALPTEYALEQNYPNPFNPETEFRFQLPRAGQVVLNIFNILGARVRTLVDAPYQPGSYRVRWDGKDDHGNAVASGVYLYRMHAGAFSQVRKMSLIR